MTGTGEPEQPWTDLTGNRAGEQVTREAARRRRVEGEGADRSWRLGAEGEHVVADALAELTVASRWDRLRRREPEWWALHSVPVGTGTVDIDHVLCGPPGVFTINTKHHRTKRVEIDDHQVLVGGRPTRYVEKAVFEAARAGQLLRAGCVRLALSEPTSTGVPERVVAELVEAELFGELAVRPVLVVVGARLLGRGRPGGVVVTTPARLALLLRELPTQLTAAQVRVLYEVARRSTTWAG